MADRSARAADHASHDLELVARAAAGDLAASEAIAGRDLLAACPACAAIASDLRAIASATRTLPDAAARSARLHAPRDFRLSPADAARLRRRGFLGLGRRLAGLGFGGRAQGFGGALVSLGLVGLLVSAGVPALFGGAAGGLAISSGQLEDSKLVPHGPDESFIQALATGDGNRTTTLPASDVGLAASPPWAAITAGSFIVALAGLVLLAIGRQGGRSRSDGT